MLTIGELASYAAVTVRAIRHYHATGLLPEPERDQSGYRRYDGSTVVELIKIRTLTEAGVPLARVRQLLRADAKEFTAALTDIDERLHTEIRQRQRHRERIARLTTGDNLALPPELVRFLDQLRALGVDERIIRLERDGWIPLATHSPDQVRKWLARKQQHLTDPPLIDFYLTLGRSLDRPSDDLPHLADELATYLTHLASTRGDDYIDTDITPDLADLLDTLAFATAPPARHLIELLTERGWTGWSKLERVR
ncbi:MerR family transcriptional regulator [Nocardia terpenica]|uniref:helix-turn-helix domain-containing protein n=1 Tax=Nocardia terpenica TaxID=455432 RepID=UPI001893CDF5|nr:MerR family transcriptional regulator [Nocardia terpenica]MBF6059194.1 MerR family transcriptional regulator [Nocardia terpenica]MBF6103267.1 MerR family transcriptional regulator [Nocardia terpenica]MBF6110544.1 MerR family transcriptional regulator [Nocardia terpenica]MBF6116675.1 MerR family transcriptional regulator [Nocardia terpenica]